jgi:glycosyltransferase involved in cell wall biosynthesis
MSYILSVVIPAYNEEATIHLILDKILDVYLDGIEKEIVIVNDCSKDRTQATIEEYIKAYPGNDIRLVNQPVNKGKGAAIHRGIDEASGDFIIIQDAAGEFDYRNFGNNFMVINRTLKLCTQKIIS